MMTEVVSFNKVTLKQFKKAYEKCSTDTFMFKGREYVKGYAKYLIDYLEEQIKT